MKHERVKYACNKYDYAFTTQNKLKDHEKLKHEIVKYEYDKYNDNFTTQNKLKDHEEYVCDKCGDAFLSFGQSTSCKAT